MIDIAQYLQEEECELGLTPKFKVTDLISPCYFRQKCTCHVPSGVTIFHIMSETAFTLHKRKINS